MKPLSSCPHDYVWYLCFSWEQPHEIPLEQFSHCLSRLGTSQQSWATEPGTLLLAFFLALYVLPSWLPMEKLNLSLCLSVVLSFAFKLLHLIILLFLTTLDYAQAGESVFNSGLAQAYTVMVPKMYYSAFCVPGKGATVFICPLLKDKLKVVSLLGNPLIYWTIIWPWLYPWRDLLSLGVPVCLKVSLLEAITLANKVWIAGTYSHPAVHCIPHTQGPIYASLLSDKMAWGFCQIISVTACLSLPPSLLGRDSGILWMVRVISD